MITTPISNSNNDNTIAINYISSLKITHYKRGPVLGRFVSLLRSSPAPCKHFPIGVGSISYENVT